MSIEQPLTELKGVGPALAEKLAKLGLHTVQDLLFHLPLRYEDRTRVTPVAQVRVGMPAQVEATVVDSRVELGRKRSLLVRVRDDSGEIGLRFYYFTAQQKNRFSPGRKFLCYGEARLGRSGLEMYHPETTQVDELKPAEMEQRLTPIYPTTEGLMQKRLRDLCQQALTLMRRYPIKDWLPQELRSHYQMPELNAALDYLHHPPVGANVTALAESRHPNQQRLVAEELLAHHLSLLQLRQEVQSQPAPALRAGVLQQRFIEQLPFALTGAQKRVIGEIEQDVRAMVPMLRLVQGDVGSGKTVVAAASALCAIEAGHQAALMAPTEILSEQHYKTLSQWLEPLGVSVVWLNGKLKASERQKVLDAISSGAAQLAIGTHALFQDQVEFARLGLAIIDEQHRFGVHQRLSLREKGARSGQAPHQLIMTATPIPRTLAMSAYADLDTSVIDELPPGRTPVVTAVIPDIKRDDVVERVRKVCLEGRQAYWVCTLIEESEVLQCQAAEATAANLAEALPDLRVGLVHGRMKAAEKTAVMDDFKHNRLHLLVATTVIEVGVDVPNASLMIIENPERLGLAQLHQLRGRVGRGSHESYCVLMYHPPLSLAGKARMQVMRDSNDGFVIAEKDLEIRGPGEVLGTRQTGLIQFRIADLQRDRQWLPVVKEMALSVIDQPDVTEALIRRWIGHRALYGKV
ncbi:ATP-dependent DNA helicase RecG [Hahella chejuensis KCTC 2396]|uniref:ATP-dependent DNA helicase RecG n=1 Tax=Hahella chejuensis (strain KCTC 2396) TaxID=349521 RepID=Q2S8R8_HAHCH|nr:ATP-dependent DNA helicase RecG [Hahella chejuensis]ABC32956.1 ATP-dependent DNA helicase RecG [Hahella chejuensis KCTC 2396]